MIDLEELERLAKAATSGPWIHQQDECFLDVQEIRNPNGGAVADFVSQNNASYIVAACNAVPELIARVRELEERNERLTDENNILHNRWETCLQDYRRLENKVAKEAGE